MPRKLPIVLLAGLGLLAGCGGDAPENQDPSRPVGSAKPAARPDGLTEVQFRALRLRSPRDEVQSRLGAPLKVVKAGTTTECLEYRALDEAGKEIRTQRYRLCFDARDQLAVLTTRPVLR